MKKSSDNKIAQVPILFHIGTQKAASTFLYSLLSKHPYVNLSREKEVNFYFNQFERGMEWYLSTFSEGMNKIDTSPKYFMCGKEVAPRIKKFTQGRTPLFVVILRNPIDYLNSHFHAHLLNGHFKNCDKYTRLTKNLVEFVQIYPEYLSRAIYFKILHDYWLPHFKLKQFKIVIFEDFIKHPEKILDEITAFWELPLVHLKTRSVSSVSKNRMLRYPFLYKLRSWVVKNGKVKNNFKNSKIFNSVYNKFLTSTSSNNLNDNDRKQLMTVFEQDVANLEMLLDRKIDAWKDFRDGTTGKR